MDENSNPRRAGRVWAGLFLVGIGAVLVLDQMGFPLPDWLFNWPAILIVVGLFIGIRHGFRGPAWLILILIGTAFEFNNYYPQAELHRYIFPGILIIIGVMFVLSPGRGRHIGYWDDDDWRNRNKDWKHQWKQQRHEWKHDWKREWRQHRYGWRTGSDIPPTAGNTPAAGSAQTPGNSQTPGSSPAPGSMPPGSAGSPGSATSAGTDTASSQSSAAGTSTGYTSGSGSSGAYTSEDFLDTTTFFGGIHKKIVSKSFKGGDVVTIMGGTELDLTQADFIGTVRLDVVQICGATKIIVPASWEVRSEVTAIFAGFEDKRQQPALRNPDKVLILDGTSLMGGIELRNY